MTQRRRRFGRAFLTAATLAAGTVTNSCEMTWRDSFVDATKSTFIVATGQALASLINPTAAKLGADIDLGM